MKGLFYILILFGWIGSSSGQPISMVLEAFANYEKGYYAEAAQLFDALVKEKSVSTPKYQYFKGLAYFNQGNIVLAEEELEKAQKVGYTDANLWLAKIATSNKDTQKAIFYLEQYVKSKGAINIEIIKKDPAFRELHNSERWFLLWQEENLGPDKIALSDAKFFFDRKQLKQAHQILDNQLARSDTRSAEIFALKSEIYAEEGIQQLAIDEINNALLIDEKNTRYLVLKASYLQELGRDEDATEILTMVLEISPEDFSTRYRRADLAFKMNDFNLAKSDLEILTKYLKQPEYAFLKGKTDYELGNYISALKTFNQIMDTEKPRAEYYKARGMTYYQTRIFDQAAYDLSMSLDLTPDDAETNLYLGLAEKNRGNDIMACYYLQRAKKYGSREAVNQLNSFCK